VINILRVIAYPVYWFEIPAYFKLKLHFYRV